jgi:urease accessory protein
MSEALHTQRGGPNPSLASLRLLQLNSPALPIGAFAYSQGLEQAVERGWVSNTTSLEVWLTGLLARGLGTTDLPLIVRAEAAWSREAGPLAVEQLTAWVFALRETKELRDEERHLGSSLARVLTRLGVQRASASMGSPRASYLVQYGLAVNDWQLPLQTALESFAFSWLENQVAAASRLMPLGQLDAQQVLSNLMPLIHTTASVALALPDDEVGQTVPALAIASSAHERQYSRLFRS